jgi:hypothetical protein
MAAVALSPRLALGENAGSAAAATLTPRRGGVLAPIENGLASPRGGGGGASKRPRAESPARPGSGSPATPAQPRAAAAARRAPAEDPLAEALAEARELLRAPAPDDGGPPLGREAQHARLAAAAEAFGDAGQGEALYVSGLPGTGKSHTVRCALGALGAYPGVAMLWINCMAVSGANEVYGRILDALGGGSAGGGAPAARPGAKRRGGAGGGSGAGFAPADAPSAARSVSYEQLVAALSGRGASGSLSSLGSFDSAGSAASSRSGSSGSSSKRRRGAGGSSSGSSSRSAAGQRVAIVLDEVDALVDKGQQVRPAARPRLAARAARLHGPVAARMRACPCAPPMRMAAAAHAHLHPPACGPPMRPLSPHRACTSSSCCRTTPACARS